MQRQGYGPFLFQQADSGNWQKLTNAKSRATSTPRLKSVCVLGGQTHQVGLGVGNPVFRQPCRVRQDRCGERVMDATLVLIDSDAELLRARALVDQLWNSNDPADVARLEPQARLIAAYEEMKWPRRPPSVADLIRHLIDQHGLTRADLIPLLGTPSRVS